MLIIDILVAVVVALAALACANAIAHVTHADAVNARLEARARIEARIA